MTRHRIVFRSRKLSRKAWLLPCDPPPLRKFKHSGATNDCGVAAIFAMMFLGVTIVVEIFKRYWS